MISYLIVQLLDGITGTPHHALPVDIVLLVLVILWVKTWPSVGLDISDVTALVTMEVCCMLCTPILICGAWILLLPAASWVMAVVFECHDWGYTPVIIKSAAASLSMASYMYVTNECGFSDCLKMAVAATIVLWIVAELMWIVTKLIIAMVRLIAQK